jgi:hypothetical protein
MAYQLSARRQWPTVRIGERAVRVPRQALLDWIQRQIDAGGTDWVG